ncbi:MAG: dihydropteroate synthase [Bacteroidales bacterium]|nr:dihydropteroate synthase [Bacteroidales bacterium]MDD3431287.1 dihydropteroate synthase [Bacteroidales bacterium]MDD4362446.1 dihydropteroate synthase [Bacteroidales bacterium]MDD4362451.1 dihydropteroate synthase [Bacteroidales bacterium]MDD4430136.1 dihydropteroate synthase [Bacteroidales bacterium]
MDSYSVVTPTIHLRGKLMCFDTPKVMGVLNITPDSFYPGSRISLNDLEDRVDKMISEGADIIDVGACSTRPGSKSPDQQEELARLLPALDLIRKTRPDFPVSVDTFRAEVARVAVEDYQADIINDVSGGSFDAEMFPTAARLQVPYVLSHIQGQPENMQQAPHYRHLLAEICSKLAYDAARLRDLGLNDLIIDPGFGFGKSLENNYELLRRLEDLSILEAPIMVGLSRKSFIYNLLNCRPEQALNGTTVANTLALWFGAHILRVHDVREAVECVRMVQLSKNAGLC